MNQMMKALVLAGGRGSRLDELTENENKCMHEFRGIPLIEYSLRNATAAGVSEIVIVVGYKAESIINHFGNSFESTPVKYVIQWVQKGLVDAIGCSQETVGDADFMLFLADEVLIEPRHPEMLVRFRSDEVFALCGVVRVEDSEQIRKTYAMICQEDNHQIYRLIEKPKTVLNNLMGTGNCIFKNEIFHYISYTPINQIRNEKEMPDLVQCAIDQGRVVKYFDIGGQYININTLEDIEKLEQ
jgi:UDP-N-acetylglucosamine diphosphorylase / glucose-1-phosphate thymidylyltransferase / UDP-N-acetylgalactosamine diphosphorylase / glucosamine-1-phosphate N-acetyltransferase / galactosamine-1-phosphate N-acetyltransferase